MCIFWKALSAHVFPVPISKTRYSNDTKFLFFYCWNSMTASKISAAECRTGKGLKALRWTRWVKFHLFQKWSSETRTRTSRSEQWRKAYRRSKLSFHRSQSSWWCPCSCISFPRHISLRYFYTPPSRPSLNLFSLLWWLMSRGISW